MDVIQNLIEHFRRFPGIGPRQSKRFVYFLLTQPQSYRNNLSKLILDLQKNIKTCKSCQRFFPADSVHNKDSECVICSDQTRNSERLLVVSRDVDFENIEKSQSFDGKYFILGGSVPVLEKEPEEKIRLKELVDLIEKRSAGGLREIIFALDLTTEGENTEHFLREQLAALTKKHSLKLSSLGRGLSTGLELEYSDSDTIKNALKNRI